MNYAIIVEIVGAKELDFHVCNSGAIPTNRPGRDAYR